MLVAMAIASTTSSDAPTAEFAISRPCEKSLHVKSTNWTMFPARPRAASSSMVDSAAIALAASYVMERERRC